MAFLLTIFALVGIDKFLYKTPQVDVLDYIDPLIGTSTGGHVFPGANLPFGETTFPMC